MLLFFIISPYMVQRYTLRFLHACPPFAADANILPLIMPPDMRFAFIFLSFLPLPRFAFFFRPSSYVLLIIHIIVAPFSL